jgi:hypothetical protein
MVPNPADPQSLNRYTAMANNTLKYTDPTGHYEACDDGACTSQFSPRNGRAVGGAFWRRNGGLTGRRPASRSYELRIRSFAPFRSFGGGFRGDDRGYSIGFASSKTVFQIWYEPDRWSLESQVSNSYSHIGDSGGQSSGRGGISGFQMDGTARSGADGLYADAEYHGSNGMLSAIPEVLTSIDVYAKLWIRQASSNSALYVVGDLNGDNFPATEASISDAQGNTIMLGIGYYDSRGANKDWAPQAALPGYNHRTITSFALAVKLDDRGNFVSVGQLGSNVQMTIDQWNSQFTKCDPHNKSTC